MSGKYFIKNGELTAIEKATVSLFNIEYAYGFGVYETIKLQHGVIYFVEDHVTRLMESAKEIGIQHEFTEIKIIKDLHLLATSNGVASANIKILLMGAKKPENAELFILMLNPLYPNKKLYSEGARTTTLQYERLFPRAKTLNMLGSYLAFKKAKENGCYDTLLLDKTNNITEGTKTNFFAIRDKTIFSPPENRILNGITRKIILYVARKNNFEVVEQNIPLASIATYEGAFLTSTSSKIMPILAIDNFTFEKINVNLKLLSHLYNEFLENCGGKFTKE